MTSSSSPQTSSELGCVIAGCKGSRWSGNLCSMHRGRLTAALREIPRHARTIVVLLGQTSSNAGDKVSGSREQPLPAASVLALCGPQAEHSDGPVDDQAGPTVLAAVASWCGLVEEDRDLTVRTYPASLSGLWDACQTLVRNLDWISEQPWVDECYAELETVWRNVRSAACDSPQPQRGKVPCPACGMRSLWQDEPSTNHAEPGQIPVLTGGEYRCLTRLGGCGVTVQERDHDAAVVDLDSHIEQTKAVRAYGTANDEGRLSA